MTAADWVTLAPTITVLAGTGIAVIVRLTRLVDAVERLSAAMAQVAERVTDHESRITTLEKDQAV